MKHSQRANEKPLDVWCIVAQDGSISTAHCTCMAGSSEVCSHVGAVLFAAEYANKRKEEVSCTDVLGAWMMPSTSSQIPLEPVSKMDWGNYIQQEDKTIAPLSVTDINDMLKKMEQLGHSSAVMRIVEPFATDIAKKIGNILSSVFNIFDENHMLKSHMELMQISKIINLSLDHEEVTRIEKATRNQSENENWYIQRAGRITASKFKAVCKTNKATPSLSLIKSICYPLKMTFNTKATLWGIKHEPIAVEEYKKQMEVENHDSFIVNEVGLLVSTIWPQFGASPDRLVFCECCLGGCLEVKCPYSLHTGNIVDINEYAASKASCLVDKGGQLSLSKSHSYYFQVQAQIFVSQLRYCDFVIWSPNVFFKERILPDFEFWKKYCEIGEKFHSEVIMPELLGKFFTRNEGAAKLTHWCICHGVDDGRPMIKCDGEDCEMGWFHFGCVGLLDTPSTEWYCEKCDKRD